MQVAATSVDITPVEPCSLAGYANRRGRFFGIEDALEANVACFRDSQQAFVMVSLDALYVGALRAMVTERLGGLLAPEQLLMAASHTHFAPATDPRLPGLGEVDSRYLRTTAERIATAVKQVVANEGQPAELAWGQVSSAHAVNRRSNAWHWRLRPFPGVERVVGAAPNPRGIRDGALGALVVRATSDKRVLAVLWNLACHPVLFPRREWVSAEFPGVARSHLRSRLDANLPVLFLQGFAGDQRPRLIDAGAGIARVLRGPRFARPTYVEWNAWAEALGRDVGVLVASAAQSVGGDLAAARTQVPLSTFVTDTTADRYLVLQRLSFGSDLAFVGVSAEPAAEYARVVRQRIGTKFVVPVGCIDEVYGYLPTNRMIREGGYEALTFFPSFGLRGHFVADVESAFLGSLLRVV